ncbi:MAG: hypothetical protein QOI31_2580 [Solirubrobacterales bacterium]|jgi:hypothetical protein|nr:hypothetical protein [Solirubrobacterales bacterium]
MEIILALTVAIIGPAGVLAGTIVAGHFTTETQDQRFIEDREAESRAKRERTYEKYLRAANSYAVETTNALDELKRCADDQASSRPEVEACEIAGFFSARYLYQGAINNLYVYGSQDAIEAEGAISATLPSSLGAISGDFKLAKVNDSDFRAAYQSFLSIMCRELPPDPRPEC